jgi:hypothetical protein
VCDTSSEEETRKLVIADRGSANETLQRIPVPNMENWKVVAGRLVPYWLTVLMSVWILAFLYIFIFEDSAAAYEQAIATQVSSQR